MAITSIKTGSSFTNLIKYNDFLAGNTAFSPSSFESIATVTVGSGGTASVTFSSIPATYTHLQIRFICVATTGTQDLKMNFNSDTGSNYSYHTVYGGGATANTTAGASTSRIVCGTNAGGNGSFAISMSAGIIDILDYANTNKFKTTRVLNGFDTNNATTSSNNETIALGSGNWRSTSAITNIVLAIDGVDNLRQYSQFALYGIRGA
jgi:hypothetical protein